MSADLKVHGLEETLKALQLLPDKLQRRFLTQSVRAGAALMRKRARRAAPKRRGQSTKRIGRRGIGVRAPGFLRRQIILKKQRGRRVVYRVGPSRAAFYGNILEGGSRDLSPRPWFEPVWRANRRAILIAIEKKARQLFEREVKRNG